jgi:hypothetical protein
LPPRRLVVLTKAGEIELRQRAEKRRIILLRAMDQFSQARPRLPLPAFYRLSPFTRSRLSSSDEERSMG